MNRLRFRVVPTDLGIVDGSTTVRGWKGLVGEKRGRLEEDTVLIDHKEGTKE